MICGVSGTSGEDLVFPNGATLGSGTGDLLLGCADDRCLVEAVDLRCGLGDRLGAKMRSSTSNGSEGQGRLLLLSTAVVQVCDYACIYIRTIIQQCHS